jgi:hypothetical protein
LLAGQGRNWRIPSWAERPSAQPEKVNKIILEDIMKDLKKLQEVYNEWREISEEMLNDGMKGSIDCGFPQVREDFTAYAELEEEITFEEMLFLERNY